MRHRPIGVQDMQGITCILKFDAISSKLMFISIWKRQIGLAKWRKIVVRVYGWCSADSTDGRYSVAVVVALLR